jgi:hypothetical protein
MNWYVWPAIPKEHNLDTEGNFLKVIGGQIKGKGIQYKCTLHTESAPHRRSQVLVWLFFDGQIDQGMISFSDFT